MKLVFCNKCHDLVRLLPKKNRACDCGACGGQYLNEHEAEIWGDGVPVGIEKRSFVTAIKRRPISGLGYTFAAFVIPEQCPTIAVTPAPEAYAPHQEASG